MEIILINGEDRTDSVEKYYRDSSEPYTYIKFYNNEKEYCYNNDRVCIEKAEEYFLKENKVLLEKNTIIEDIEKVWLSNNYARIYFISRDRTKLCKIEDIRVEENVTVSCKNALEYYKEIAKYKDQNNEYSENYLSNQLQQITIANNDILDIYFNQKFDEIKCEECSDIIYPFGINLSQRKAVINALNNRVSIIQGPPGTGKTQSILNIIANLIIQGKTIGVVSSNNEAIKNVVDKMKDKNYGFLLALLGKRENKDVFFENQQSYPIELNQWYRSDEIKEVLFSDIKNHETKLVELLDYKNRKAILEKQLFEYKHEYKYFKEYLQNQNVEKLKRLSIFKLDDKTILKLLIDLNEISDDSENILNKLKSFFKYGVYDFRQYQNIEAIILGLQEKYYKEKIKRITEEISGIDKKLNNNNYSAELDQLKKKSKEYFEACLFDKFKKEERPVFYSGTYTKCFESFIDEYPVVLATTHSISKSIQKNFKFDYLIIDEASQVELVPGIIALGCAQNVVIVGDMKQLPHIPAENISKDTYRDLKHKYEISYAYDYHDNSLLSSFDLIFKDEVKVMLREHYRCHSQIIEFCNRKYYNNQLICLSDVSEKKPLVLCKTVPGNHLRYSKNSVNKIINLRELESVADESFVQEIGLSFDSEKKLGFIAPFRGQVNRSKDILASDFQKDTVHKFQGRECDVVLFSSVLDRKQVSKRFMDFVDEPHLINVAVSRAVERFILVSDVDVFMKEKKEICDLINYVNTHLTTLTIF